MTTHVVLCSMESTQISDAEWQVMRVVWSTIPATSGGIIKELSASSGWEPTTIKTLLSRLVKKEVLRFEKIGRTYHYYPLVSEDACIRREMRSLVEKVYGGAINGQTSHFIFKGHVDEAYLRLLAGALEENYGRISGDLEHALPEKVLVYIHATKKRLQSALGVLDGPPWLRAGCTWDILHIAPRECFDDLAPEKAAVHILTQIMIRQINESAPYWLQQAVSAYEGRWLSAERISRAVRDKFGRTDLSLLKDKAAVYADFKDSGGYELAYTVAEFVVAEYGFKKLTELLREPGDYQKTFGFAESVFWEKWTCFLRQAYKDSLGPGGRSAS